MPDTGKELRGGLAAPTRSEVADYSTTDHEFSEVPRTIDVYLNSVTAPADLVCRMLGDSTDLTISVAHNLYAYPAAITHIRNTGTTAGLTIVGRW